MILYTATNLPESAVSLAVAQELKEEMLVQEVATVYPLSDYWPLALKYVPEGASEILVSGTVKELRDRLFDFYAFTKLNYERWKADASYQAAIEAKRVADYTLSLPTTRQDVIDGLRLVVSNVYAQETKEEKLIDETIRLPSFSTYTFWFSPPPLMIGFESELSVSGMATEIHGHRFNIYIMHSKDYDLWSTGRSYSAYYVGNDRESYEFSFVIPPEKARESVYFIVERGDPDVELDVDVAATGAWMAPTTLSVEYDVRISWKEKTTGCLIATVAYGSELEPQVQFMREFRDEVVGSTSVGKSFLSVFNPFYYSFSPQAAELISTHQYLKELTKYSLYPLVGAVNVAGQVYLIFRPNAELAVGAALLTAGILLMIIYSSPIVLVVCLAVMRHARNRRLRATAQTSNSQRRLKHRVPPD